MTDLIDFLLARIAEDEAQAREALSPPNMYPWGDRRLPKMTAADWPDAMRGYLGGPWGEHGARWNPTRVLAECTTKRAILARWDAVDDMATVLRETKTDGSVPVDFAAALTPLAGLIDGIIRNERDALLRLLALPHADHPDYRPEWRP